VVVESFTVGTLGPGGGAIRDAGIWAHGGL
jgi:hypothetical protein